MTEAQRRPLEIGSVHELKHEQYVKVIEYVNKSQVLVEFQDTYRLRKWANKSQITNGSLRNPYRKTIFDRGFLGDGEFNVKCGRRNTPEYAAWHGIFRRCYDEASLARNPTYIGCYVDEDWYNFQDFARWVSSQPQFQPGWDVDKDLLVKGNRCYSKETCCLLPREINCFLAIGNSDNGCPPGVHFGSVEGKYKAQIRDRHSGNSQRCLGLSSDPLELFNLYKEAKEAQAKFLAEKWKDALQSDVYEKLILWTVEIGGLK